MNCQKLEARTREALQRIGAEATIEKVTEPMDIVDYGVTRTPALVVDGKVKVMGGVPEVDDLVAILGEGGSAEPGPSGNA